MQTHTHPRRCSHAVCTLLNFTFFLFKTGCFPMFFYSLYCFTERAKWQAVISLLFSQAPDCHFCFFCTLFRYERTLKWIFFPYAQTALKIAAGLCVKTTVKNLPASAFKPPLAVKPQRYNQEWHPGLGLHTHHSTHYSPQLPVWCVRERTSHCSTVFLLLTQQCLYMCVCVCVCMCETEQ